MDLGDYILVVDDDRDIRESLAELLAEKGHRVEVAANGDEALSLLRTTSAPCLILLDLMMPVMDGWQFADEKAADPALAGIPVCVITAGGPTQPLPPAALCVLRKPFNVDELFQVVATNC